MRKLIIFLTLAILLSPFPLAGQDHHPLVTVNIDGLPVNFDVNPLIKDGRVLVPFRAISESLNTEVEWQERTRTIWAQHHTNTILLEIGSNTAFVNNNPLSLDVPPVIVQNRTLIPLRFFTEALGSKVDWDPQDYIVTITSPPKEMTVVGFYALGDRQTSSWTNLFQREYPQSSIGNTDVIGELALGWYSLDEEGNLLTRSRTGWQRPPGWEDVLEAAQKYNLKTDMVVHATNKDRLLNTLLENPFAVEKLVANIVNEAPHYTGVNLNLEGLGLSQRGQELIQVQDSFTNFVTLLAQHLKAIDKPLTLTLHAPNSVYKGYDYQALGEIADRIIIMAYEYGATPEPVNRVVEAVEMAKTLVANDKLLLGINIPRETPASLLTKVGVAKRYDLEGIALWRLGLITPEMWSNLRMTISDSGLR